VQQGGMASGTSGTADTPLPSGRAGMCGRANSPSTVSGCSEPVNIHSSACLHRHGRCLEGSQLNHESDHGRSIQ
jgi:hypothetical protein